MSVKDNKSDPPRFAIKHVAVKKSELKNLLAGLAWPPIVGCGSSPQRVKKSVAHAPRRC